MRQLKIFGKVLLVLLVFLVSFRSCCFSDIVFRDDEFMQERQVNVLQDPTVGPTEEETKPRKDLVEVNNTTSNQEIITRNQNQYFVVGIVLLLIAAINALIIIKIARKNKN